VYGDGGGETDGVSASAAAGSEGSEGSREGVKEEWSEK